MDWVVGFFGAMVLIDVFDTGEEPWSSRTWAEFAVGCLLIIVALVIYVAEEYFDRDDR